MSSNWDYDIEECGIMERMIRTMIHKHNYDREDFEDCTFTDVESMFLDDCGEPDFR